MSTSLYSQTKKLGIASVNLAKAVHSQVLVILVALNFKPLQQKCRCVVILYKDRSILYECLQECWLKQRLFVKSQSFTFLHIFIVCSVTGSSHLSSYLIYPENRLSGGSSIINQEIEPFTSKTHHCR